MMIRSITYTINLNRLIDGQYLDEVSTNIECIKRSYLDNGIKIRTVRFNVISIESDGYTNLIEKVELLSAFAKSIDIRWFCIAIDLIGQPNKVVDSLCELGYEIIKNFDNAFVNFLVAKDYIDAYAVLKASEIVKNVSTLTDNGIDNFRLGLSLNVQANTPFFPFSYSDRNESFSIAIESTNKIINVVKKHFDHDYIALKNDILKNISTDLLEIESIANKTASSCNLTYNGQDISLSPYPDEDISVIEILNLLGIDDFGSNGTQFLTSYLTSVLKEAISTLGIKSVGFNGVMYSLLEDKLMCKAHDEKNFTMDSVILYSTVCGCGLDMIPLPGNVLTEEVASMVLDVATTSIKLSKPLGFRALPISGKYEGDLTDLKLDFLTNTKIPSVKHIHIDKSIFKNRKFKVKH